MKSNSIFTVTHRQGDERIYRAQDGTKGTQKCLCDVGYIAGNAWNMLAITLPGFTDNEAWYVINLVDQQNVFIASVAVLGATSGEHAVNMALRTFNGDFCGIATASPYDVPEAQAFVLKRLLDNEARAMYKSRVNYEELEKIRKRLTLVPAMWNDSAEIVSHKNVGELVSDIARNDYNSELVTKASPASIQSEVMQDSETDQYDSIVTQVSRLDAWSKRIMLAMGEAADTVKPVNVTTTEPFKKNGVVNVAQIYELSDGQTATIVYHNPDSTPARLDAKDILTSWKFLLNKRDVTAVLQPKSGKDVNVNDLAKRILKIAEANSARFIRNQERKAGAQQALDELDKIEQEKRDLLASLIQEIADLQRQLDEPIGSFAADKEKGTISGSNDDPQIAANGLVTNANGDIVNKQGDAFSARSITQRIITNSKLVGYVPKRTAEGYVLHRFDEPYFKENGSIIIGNPKSSNTVIKCEPKLIFERFGRTFVVVQNNEAGQNQFETVDLITRLSIPSQDGETLFSSIMDAYKQTSNALDGFTEEQFNNSTLAKTPQADYTEAVLMAEGKLPQPSEEQVQVESSNPLTETQEDTEVQEQMANELIPEPIQAEVTMNDNQNENPDEKWLDQIIAGEIDLAPLNMNDFSQVAEKYVSEINTPIYAKLEQALTAITSAKMEKAKAVQGA
ncbi:hypothetical protein [Acinetobacter calcoaceticus]|uniref:defense against restriction DarA-related protein n=1 Tax=Acinetobacter calcoaceticus TaxID=471 RepID=UPI00300B3757